MIYMAIGCPFGEIIPIGVANSAPSKVPVIVKRDAAKSPSTTICSRASLSDA